jgi:DNA-binding transcriptional MerR regulator
LNKAPDAFRTISEVAEELDLPQHVLRFWESRFPNIKPLKRGGGRRYYRPEDVDLLRGIRRLLYSDGYTIKGVQRILREQGVRTVQLVGQGLEMHGLDTLPRDESEDGEDRITAALEGAAPQDDPKQNSREQDSRAKSSDGEHDGEPAAPPPRPKNGRIAKVNSTTVGAVVNLEAGHAGQARIGIHQAAIKDAGVSNSGNAAVNQLAVTAAAVVMQPIPVLAVQDLDRLRRALAELETCRRLLEKAIEGER